MYFLVTESASASPPLQKLRAAVPGAECLECRKSLAVNLDAGSQKLERSGPDSMKMYLSLRESSTPTLKPASVSWKTRASVGGSVPILCLHTWSGAELHGQAALLALLSQHRDRPCAVREERFAHDSSSCSAGEPFESCWYELVGLRV